MSGTVSVIGDNWDGCLEDREEGLGAAAASLLCSSSS